MRVTDGDAHKTEKDRKNAAELNNPKLTWKGYTRSNSNKRFFLSSLFKLKKI